MQADQITWACATCGKVHRGLPAVSFDAPSHYYGMPEEERRKRALLNSDNCVVDNAAFCVRTVLKVPIIGRSEMLEWGVWSSLSAENFTRYYQTFADLDQSKLGPMSSWFSSSLPGYPSTLNLASRIVPQDNRQRPRVELDLALDHPLIADVRDGIMLEHAIAFVEPVLHRH